MKRLAILLILTLAAIVPSGCSWDLEHSGSQRVTVDPFNTAGRGMFYPTSNHRSWDGEPMDYR